jgi:molybdopterin-containing oxidoreductase family membrane subunit
MTSPTPAQRSKFPWLVGAGFLVMLLAGLPGVVERVAPASASGSDATPWGLWITGYIFFSGISAGAFPIAALPSVFNYGRFRPLVGTALLVAVSALVGALLFVLVQGGHAERAAADALRPHTTPVMFWVLSSCGVYSVILAMMSYFVFRPAWGESAARTGKRVYRLLSLGYRGTPAQVRHNELALRLIGGVGLIVALTLAGAVGTLFVGLGAPSYSHSGLFPITFVVSALLSGAATVLATSTLLGRGGLAFKTTLLLLARLMGLLLAVELVIIPVEAVVALTGGNPAHIAVLQTVGAGPFAWVFWVLQLGFGTLVALWLLIGSKQRSLAVASVAALYVLLGVFAFRLNFVIPQLVDRASAYVPSAMEWNVSIYCFGVTGLVLLVGSRLLPVFPANAPMAFELAAHESEAVPFPAGARAGAEFTEVPHV